MVEEGPLIQCTTAQYCRGNTIQRRYMNPVGTENDMRIYKEKNLIKL